MLMLDTWNCNMLLIFINLLELWKIQGDALDLSYLVKVGSCAEALFQSCFISDKDALFQGWKCLYCNL